MSHRAKRQLGGRPLIEALEDHVLYSADALGGIDSLALNNKDDIVLETGLLPIGGNSSDEFAEQSQQSTANATHEVYELIFVDTDTENYQQLVDGLLNNLASDRNVNVHILDNARSGIEQITEVLASYESLDAVHIISHGTDAAIDLGQTHLDTDTLNAHSLAIAAWGDAFDDSGDLLIYGCDIAATRQGQLLVDRLAQITGTDVAASVDPTGTTVLGGDWDLEYQYGDIASDAPLSAQSPQSWSGILAGDTTTGLIGRWSFDSNADDSSGNNYHGTLNGNAFIDPDNSTDNIGVAKLALDGSGDHVNLDAHIASLGSLTEGTVSAWIKSTDGDESTIFGVSDALDPLELSKFSIEGGQLKWLNINHNGGYIIAYSDALVNDGLWHHVAVTVGAGGNSLYIDGALASTTYANSGPGDTTFYSDITDIDTIDIGRSVVNGAVAAEFDGLLDEVRLYNRALTAIDIAALASPNNAPIDLSSGIEINNDGGNDAFLQASDGGALLGGLTSITVETKFQFAPTTPAESTLISYAVASDTDEFAIITDQTNNQLRVIIGDGTNGTYFTTADYTKLFDNQQHDLAVSWDSTNGALAIYLDGELHETATGYATGYTVSGTSGDGILIVGQEQDSYGGDFETLQAVHGTLYDIRIWNSIRSAAEIALNHQHKIDSGSLPNGLIANWQMDGFSGPGSDEVVEIISGNNLSINHATGTGFTSSTPVDDLHIMENPANGTTVGYVIPTDPDVHDDIVSDGLFMESGVANARYTLGQTFGNWTVIDGEVNHGSTSATPMGGHHVELNGLGVPGTITQNLATVAGREYQVLFSLSGRFDAQDAIKDLRIEAGGESQDFSMSEPHGWTASDFVWDQRSFTFTASSSTTQLSFQSLDAIDYGPVIADIQVIETSPAISTILANDPTLTYDAGTGKFYKVVTTSTDVHTATSNANNDLINGVGGQLVTIRSDYENEVVRNITGFTSNFFWIGGTDYTNEGEWNWIEDGAEDDRFWNGAVGGSAPSSIYANFQSEPGGGTGENYALIRPSDGIWLDVSSAGNGHYVVEWNASEVLSAFNFSLSDDAGGRFAIDPSSGEVTVADGYHIDYEDATSYDIGIDVTDVEGNVYNETMSIAVDDGIEHNAAPTDISSGIELNTEGGNDAYLQANDGGAIFGGATEFTIEISFSTESSTQQNLINYLGSNARNDLSLVLETDGTASLLVDNFVIVGLAGIDYNTLRDGELHSIALSWDNTNGDWRIHVDGELTDHGTGFAAGGLLDGSTGVGSLVFGQEQDTLGGGFDSSQIFSGVIYDARFWNHTRSEAEIALNYQHKLDVTPAEATAMGLIANWQMNGFNGSNEIVDIVAGNNLSIGHVAAIPQDTYINVTGGVSSYGSTLKFDTESAPNGYASQVNSQTFSSLGFIDDYTVSFTLDKADAFNFMIGLGLSDTGTGFGDIDHAMYFIQDGRVASYHNGAFGGSHAGSVADGDEFSFYVNGTTLEFQHNGVVIHTETITANSNWYLDTSFNSDYSDVTLSNIRVFDGNTEQTSFSYSDTPVGNLLISENAVEGTSIGHVVPSKPDVNNDIVGDGLFTEVGDGGGAPFTTYSSGQTIGAWSVESGDVDLHRTLLENSPLGGYSIDLAGTGPGSISQTLSTEIGKQYQVTFAVSGNWSGGQDLRQGTVSAGNESLSFSVSEPNGWSATNLLWEYRTVTFTADSTSTVLQFESQTSDDWGPVIADVQVIAIPEAISTFLSNDPTLSYDAATKKFYRFVNSPENFSTALAAATGSALNGVAGQLVTIRSDYENELIRQHALDGGNQIWIGTWDTNNDGNWNWLAGSSESNEEFWTGGVAGSAAAGFYAPEFYQSEAVDEDYARLMSTGQWNDHTETANHAYVIEWDASEVLSSYTFALTDISNNFEINSGTGEISLAANNTLDYETNQSHDVDVTVTDADGNSYSESVTIAVKNGAEPTQSVPAAQSINEDEVLTFAAGNGNPVVIGDTLDGTDAPLQAFISVNDGVLNLSQTTGLSILGGSNNSWFMTIQGLESDINAAFEGMTFTPDADFSGNVTLNLTTSLGADMQSHYAFEGDAVDQATGLSNDGTLEGGVGFVNDAERGIVLNLDGVDDGVLISPDINFTESVTLSAWVNVPVSGAAPQQIISLSNDVYLKIETDGTVSSGYRTAAGLTWATTNSIDSIVGTGWHHVSYTMDIAAEVQRIYIDGQLAAESTHADSIVRLTNQHAIGRNSTSGAEHLAGQIDEARIYNRALSADEIAALAADNTSSSDSMTITVNPGNDAPVIAGSNLLTNGDFETGDLSGWSTTGAASNPGDQLQFGSADSPSPHSAFQSFSTVSGQTYKLVFEYHDNSASKNQTLQIAVDGATNNLETLRATSVSGTSSTTTTLSFVADSTTSTLTFTDLSTDSVAVDGFIDNISVIEQPTFTTITEDDINNAGNSVASLISSVSGDKITDIDGDPEGIAITSTSAVFEYSTNGGADWQRIDNVSTFNALLLRATDLIRFLPNTSASENERIEFCAWDQTSGSFGTYASTSTNGGNSAFSVEIERATIITSDINDAPVFGSENGYSVPDGQSGYNQNVASLVFPDGSILFTPYDSNNESVVAKLRLDGQLDLSFGNNGYFEKSSITYIQGIVEQADGKLVIAGEMTDDVALVRYNADGTIDTTFGSAGIVTTDINGRDEAYEVVVQADGKIVIVGKNESDSIIVRYNDDGSLDTTFGSSGVVTISLASTFERMADVQIQSDGKIVAVGESHIVRLNTDGSFDNTFDGDGIVDVGHRTNGLTLQTDGQIAVTGFSGDNLVVSRFNTNGSIDSGFGTAGVFTWNHALVLDAYGIKIVQQSDGKLVVAGTVETSGNFGQQWAVIRLNPDGTLDTTFGADGSWLMERTEDYAESYSLSLYDDGGSEKIIVGGYSSLFRISEATIVRLNADGTLDSGIQSGQLDGNPTFIEGGSAVVLDGNVQIFDAELSGAADFGGASLSLARTTVANGDDVFSATGLLGVLTESGNLVYDGSTVGTVVTNSGGTLVLSFNSNVDNGVVNRVMQNIAYQNTSDAPPASVQIEWIFDDGGDSVTTQGSPGALQVSGNSTVTITPVDDPALITGNISGSGNEGNAVTGTMIATDAEGLSDGTIFTVTTAATRGTASIDIASGAWTFTPTDVNWFGSDSFTVTVTDDSGGTTTQVVSVTLANVDDPAVIAGNISYNGNEGDLVAGTISATDIEGLADGTIFTITAVAANGTAVIDPASGGWTFTPTDANWFGSDNFTVTVTDDLGGTTTQIINITLTNVDDSAVISGDISYNGNEGDSVFGTLTATDIEGLTDGTVFTVSAPAANGSAVIDPAIGTWTFIPTDVNWFGSDNFTVTVTDDSGGTTTQVVSVTLANVDDPAVIAGNISYNGNEGDLVAGTMTATDVDGLADGTVFTVTAAAANGTALIDPASGGWTFIPTDINWFGSDSFTVTVTDDQGGTTTQTVNIMLTNVDDSSIISGDISFNGNEGDSVFGTLTATDIEGLTDGTVFTVSTPAANGSAVIDATNGAWTFTPADANWFGSDNFTVTVTDDSGGTTTQVVSITLANVDDPAVIAGNISYNGNEGDLVAGTMTATDIEGLTDGTIFTLSAPATNGTAVIAPASGAWTFTPTDANWFGSDNFTVTVTDDSGGTTSQIVSITLTNVDDPTVISGDISFNGNEGDPVSGTLTATDIEGLADNTIFTVTAAAANGTAVIDPANGAWTFIPTDINWFGNDSFTVTVTDDQGGTTTQVVSIALTNVDDPTVISGNISYNGNEGDLVSGLLTTTDVEGLTDGTIFSVSAPATHGTAVIDPASGAWIFIPTDTDWFGSDSFTVTVTDDLGGSNTQVVSITLANVDDPAVISGDIGYTGNEGDSISGTLAATDVDGLGDGTIFTTSTAANGIAVIDPASGAWTFTPTDTNWFGSDSFTVNVTDDLGGSTTQVINITLASINDPAIVSGADSGVVIEDVNLVSNLLILNGRLNIVDADANESLFQAETVAGVYGELAIDTSGVWRYSVDNNQAVVQQLDSGERLAETLTVSTFDGTTHDLIISINGSEDEPVITGTFSGLVVKDETLIYSNSIMISDIDSSDNPIRFADLPSTLGDNGYGYFELSSGIWTYTLDNALAVVQSLDSEDTLSDTHSFLASDGSSQTVTVAILGSAIGLPSAALPETIAPAGMVDPISTDSDSEDSDYDWLAAIITAAASEPAATVDTITEPSETPSIATETITESAPVIAVPEEASQETAIVKITARRSEPATPPPFDDLLALKLILGPAQVLEQDALKIADIPDKSFQFNLRHATTTMRDQMSDSANDQRLPERVADVALRVSTTALSAGSLAWLLRGGSLFASALSAVPTWQGFDPLPVLAKNRHSRKWWQRRERRRSSRSVDRAEAKAGRILDSIENPDISSPRHDSGRPS